MKEIDQKVCKLLDAARVLEEDSLRDTGDVAAVSLQKVQILFGGNYE